MEKSGKNPESQTQQIPATLKAAPLTQEIIKKMAGTECLRYIQETTGLAEHELFKLELSDSPNRKWNRNEVLRLVVMLLEGVSTVDAANFYSREFTLLSRKKDLALDKNAIELASHRFLSLQLTKLIRMRRTFLRSHEGLALDVDIQAVITELEHKTGLPRNRLFSGKKIRQTGLISPLNLLKSFSLRLDNIAYETIVERLFSSNSQSHNEDVIDILKAQVSRMFSPEARNQLPHHKRGGGTT